MKILNKSGCIAGAIVSAVIYCQSAVAGVATGFLTVDENGHGFFTDGIGPGTPLPFALTQDPGPGGLAHVLTYNLGNVPGVQVAGDVLMTDANAGGAVLDVLRFDGQGHLFFYSDNIGGADNLADTPQPPTFEANSVRIPEIGDEGNNGAIYSPLPGQPGYDSFHTVYHFISDSPTPEGGATVLFLGLGLAGLFAFRRVIAVAN